MKKVYFLFIACTTLSLAGRAQVLPGICMVSVDDSSKHNIIHYDKTQWAVADSFILHRETSVPGVYARVKANHKSVLSSFLDMDTAANPNVELHRYKLQIWDQVGGYSQLGPYHATLYCLQVDTDYSWNYYDVEGTGSGMVNEYLLLRDDNSLNQWHAIDSVSGTINSTKDPQALSFPNGAWRLVTKWSLSCTPTSRLDVNETQATIVKSKSNITNNKTMGVNGPKASWVKLYPNPASDRVLLRMSFPLAHKSSITLYNTLGAEVMRTILPAGKDELEIPVSDLPKGMYVMEFSNPALKMNKRLAVE